MNETLLEFLLFFQKFCEFMVFGFIGGLLGFVSSTLACIGISMLLENPNAKFEGLLDKIIPPSVYLGALYGTMCIWGQ